MNAPICRSADTEGTGLMSPDGVSPAPAPDLAALLDEAREALKYARRFLKPEHHDTAYIDAAIARIDAVRKEKP